MEFIQASNIRDQKNQISNILRDRDVGYVEFRHYQIQRIRMAPDTELSTRQDVQQLHHDMLVPNLLVCG